MHKRIVNEATLTLEISPVGPVLIKASEQGADPTKPDMEFVETYHAGGKSVYLPGSSLKGAIRAHCERIVRTVGGGRPADGMLWACDPLNEREPCRKLSDKYKNGTNRTAAIYKDSCTICQLFGSTDLAAHARIADAHPVALDALRLEERNGVAIDRVFGSVAVGPFNYQVLTEGSFETRIRVKNFTTPQLALLALAIRDFAEQRVGIGFAKSRGMGQVNMQVKRVTIRYPSALYEDGQIVILGGQPKPFASNRVLGAGELVDSGEGYGFPTPDNVEAPVHAISDEWDFGATLNFETPDVINDLWRSCVLSWRRLAQGG
jgi:CRISPR-associated RAMP protein (TIGR02581 family)